MLVRKHVVIAQVRGLYAPDLRRLEIVVAPDIEVSQQDMRVACALRLHHRLTKPESDRVEQIAYVFIDREVAESHLVAAGQRAAPPGCPRRPATRRPRAACATARAPRHSGRRRP
jgi:hypothetical protein